MAKSLKQRVTARQKVQETDEILEGLIPYKPESKLLLQPSRNGKNRGRIRVFVEEPSGERTDYGFFDQRQIMEITLHYLLPAKGRRKELTHKP